MPFPMTWAPAGMREATTVETLTGTEIGAFENR
jgi:hypothetical protein